MLMALPGTDETWLSEVTSHGALQCLVEDPGLKLIENRSVEFGCTCDQERLIQVMQNLFKDNPAELFGDGATAEVSCPQCGKQYTLNRDEFDKQDEPD